MCGRFVLAADAEDYVEYFSCDRLVTEPLAHSYNVAPTDPVYTVADWGGERLLGVMGWGLVPHWAKDRKAIQINARAETVTAKSMFRDSLSRKRCLIPADGFYEWEPKDRGRTPHWIHRTDGEPMALAGIWATWHDRGIKEGRPPASNLRPQTGELVRTCAIITTRADGVVAPIHDRMPVSLPPDVWEFWLDRDLTDLDRISALIRPIKPELLSEHPVSAAVNSVRNNLASLTQPVGSTQTR